MPEVPKKIVPEEKVPKKPEPPPAKGIYQHRNNHQFKIFGCCSALIETSDKPPTHFNKTGLNFLFPYILVCLLFLLLFDNVKWHGFICSAISR